MYNENNEQIFIKIDPDKEAVEFLLAAQAIEMIRAKIVTKDEIRATVESGRQDNTNYSKTFVMPNYNVAMTVFVRVDGFLRIIENVEKLYF